MNSSDYNQFSDLTYSAQTALWSNSVASHPWRSVLFYYAMYLFEFSIDW